MKSFCIIGLGNFGKTLALTLSERGHQVLVIDSNPDKVNSIADLVTSAVIGDPTLEKFLAGCGAKDYDCAVVCLTETVNDNILLTIMLKELGIKQVVARASSEGHKRVLERIGADMVVFPEQDMAEKLAFTISGKNVNDYIDLSGCKLVEYDVPDSWIGKSIAELNVRRRFGVSVISVSTPGKKEADVFPAPDFRFKGGEKVSVIGKDKDIDRLTTRI